MGLNRLGKRILLVDFDQDLSLSCKSNGQIENIEKAGIGLFAENAKPNEILVDHNEIKIIPSSSHSTISDVGFTQELGYKDLVRNGVNNLEGSDFISVDCPPGLGIKILILL